VDLFSNTLYVVWELRPSPVPVHQELSFEKAYVEAQEHVPKHESRETEQPHAQSCYSERKMEGAIHIPRQLQKQSLNVQQRADREEGKTDKYPPTL